MQINNNPVEAANAAMEQILNASMNQSTDMTEKLLKVNIQQQVDISQLETMGNTIDLYV